MPGQFVYNGDGTWTLYSEGYKPRAGQVVICDENDPERNKKLTDFLGIKINLPPIREKTASENLSTERAD